MKSIAVIYWSGTGNTESMANAIAGGIKSAGGAANVMGVPAADTLADYEKIAFGCPSMGNEVLEESEFEPYFSSIESELQEKKVALFGSYGWGDGQWMRDWQDRVIAAGAVLFEKGLIVNGAPDTNECESFGKRFAEF